MAKFWERLRHGGPEYQERKQAEREAKAEARKVELEAYREGLKVGARKKGRAEGIAKGSGKGGIMGGLAAGFNAFESGASKFGGDIDFGGLGSGLYQGSAFGVNMGGGRKASSKPRKHRRSSYPRGGRGGGYVWVEGPPAPRRRRSRR